MTPTYHTNKIKLLRNQSATFIPPIMFTFLPLYILEISPSIWKKEKNNEKKTNVVQMKLFSPSAINNYRLKQSWKVQMLEVIN